MRRLVLLSVCFFFPQTASSDQLLGVTWDFFGRGTTLWEIELNGRATGLAATGIRGANSLAGGPILAFTSEARNPPALSVLDLRNGDVVSRIEVDLGLESTFDGIRALTLTESGTLFAAVATYPARESIIYELDPSTGQVLGQTNLGQAYLQALELMPDGRLLGWGIGLGLLEIDLVSGDFELLSSFPRREKIQALALAADGVLWGVGVDLFMVDVATGIPTRVAPIDFGSESPGSVRGVVFVSDPSGPPSVRLEPDSSLRKPGEAHTVTAVVADPGGVPASGVEVRFEIVGGPNIGVGNEDGICAASTACVTDEAGVVSFSYFATDAGGVDVIIASIPNGDGGEVQSNVALMFWDLDCNENAVADHCDIDCAGFGGLCIDALACGQSRDDDGDMIPDECNRAPDCRAAYARPAIVWPPNRETRIVSVNGVADADGDEVAVVITSIRQDEPVVGQGFGRAAPDAGGLETATAEIRAERGGIGRDGRVYHIGFTADDRRGGECEGTVSVCVPHDLRTASCVDQGPLFDSTETSRPTF